MKTLLRICDNISRVSDTVNQIEWLRKQLEVVETMLRPPKKQEKAKPTLAEGGDEYEPEPAVAPRPALDEAQTKQKAQLLKAAEDLDKKLQAIESRLVSQALQNSDDKYFVEPYKVYLNLLWLNAEVGTGGGDVAGSADFAPTETQLQLLSTFETEMAGVDADYRKVLKDDLPAFNHALEGSNLASLVAVVSSEPAKRE